MSLRLQINLLIAGLMAVFVAAMFVFELASTRNSVREEIQASNVVAAQLLSNFDWSVADRSKSDGRLALVNYLSHLGRVRSVEMTLVDEGGQAIYHSPPSYYKAGRDAPGWYAALVTPDPLHQSFVLPGGRLLIEANASRAVLDGWDDMVRLFEFSIVVLAIGNVWVFWLVGRATRPFRRIVSGLQAMQAGRFDTRLPRFTGAESAAIADAFNRMAQAIQDNLDARQEAIAANLRLEQNREMALLVQNRLEDERRAIARELHDETGQSITAIRSLAQSLVQRFRHDEAARQTAQLIADTGAQLYASMHEMIPRLRPLAFDDMTLADALEEQVTQWRLRYPALDFRLSVHAPDNLGDTYLLAACRIVQEAVVNAIRHAAATRVEITVDTDADVLRLRIRDDGIGLQPDWQQPGHFGIRGMQEGARVLGGDVTVAAATPHGVSVAATLPLK